jgi:hypothetical protein
MAHLRESVLGQHVRAGRSKPAAESSITHLKKIVQKLGGSGVDEFGKDMLARKR